jgi:hypothetical protein
MALEAFSDHLTSAGGKATYQEHGCPALAVRISFNNMPLLPACGATLAPKSGNRHLRRLLAAALTPLLFASITLAAAGTSTSWTAVPSPSVTTYALHELAAATWVSAQDCRAVGYYVDASNFKHR